MHSSYLYHLSSITPKHRMQEFLLSVPATRWRGLMPLPWLQLPLMLLESRGYQLCRPRGGGYRRSGKLRQPFRSPYSQMIEDSGTRNTTCRSRFRVYCIVVLWSG